MLCGMEPSLGIVEGPAKTYWMSGPVRGVGGNKGETDLGPAFVEPSLHAVCLTCCSATQVNPSHLDNAYS